MLSIARENMRLKQSIIGKRLNVVVIVVGEVVEVVVLFSAFAWGYD